MTLSVLLLLLLASTVELASGYSWYISTSYTDQKCSNPRNGTESLVMLQVNKCFQTSATSSAMTLCKPISVGPNNFVVRTEMEWNNDNCDGPGKNFSYTIPSKCLNGIIFTCVIDPPQDNWPGIGIWTSSGGGQTCAPEVGPQNVELVPPYCNTDGIALSWLFSCAGNTLQYVEFASTNCTDNTILTATEQKFDTDVCFDYVDAIDGSTTDGKYRAFASCSIATISGVGLLSIPGDMTIGHIKDATLSGGAAAGITVGVVILAVLICLGGYYLAINYNVFERAKLKEKKKTVEDESNSAKKERRQTIGQGIVDQWNDMRSDTNWRMCLINSCTCSCCQDDFQ